MQVPYVKVRSACVRAFRLNPYGRKCTKIRMRVGRPIRSSMLLAAACRSLSPMLFSSCSLNISNHHALSLLTPNASLLTPASPRTTAQFSLWQLAEATDPIIPTNSCPRARKQKEKCDDAEEATASKIVHRNVVIIKDSSVETLSITQKPHLKSIMCRPLKMNIGSFQAVFLNSPPLPQPSH